MSDRRCLGGGFGLQHGAAASVGLQRRERREVLPAASSPREPQFIAALVERAATASSRAESKLLSQFLKANGYHSSPHAEVSAWGELALAWRADRCQAPGMGGRPLWHTLAVKPQTR